MITDALQSTLVETLWRGVAAPLDPGTADGNTALTDAAAPRSADVHVTGRVTLDSAFAASEFAAAAIGVAGRAAALLDPTADPGASATPAVHVDRPLAAAWFRSAVTLIDVEPVSPWDPIAGDYRTADGWIRLHTNAPRHRAAALAVLGVAADRDAVAAAAENWRAAELEDAVVAAGGCAAVMHSSNEWARHPQGVAVAAEPLVSWMPGRATPTSAEANGIRGARVLDLTRIIAGPVATRFLAGLGADVLRIDPPDWDELVLEVDMTLGKRCARLDLKSRAGLERLRELISASDVVVHGYRADALERLGLGDLDALRPGIVDVALDAYGWSGPWRNRRGFDSLVQMSTGIAEEGMRWAGNDRPTPLPVQALDHATGYLTAAAVLVGLCVRSATGAGTAARLSLARTALELAAAGRGSNAADHPDDPDDPGELSAASVVLTTPWGAARLLESPVTVGGGGLRFERSPRPLGSDDPAWAERSLPGN